MIHEKPISESGWTGAGYTVIDPETGAGGYLIEGGARGAFVHGVHLGMMVVVDLALYVATSVAPIATVLPAYLSIILAGEIAHAASMYAGDPELLDCFWGGFFFGLGGLLAVMGGPIFGGTLSALISFVSWILPGVFIPNATAIQCKAFPWM